MDCVPPLYLHIHILAFGSLHPHTSYCISTTTYQPLYLYIPAFVSLHPHTSLCIITFTYQLLYLCIHITAFVPLYPHTSLCISAFTYQPFSISSHQSLYIYIHIPAFVSLHPHTSLSISTSTYQSLYLHIHMVLKSDGLVVLLTSQELLPIIEYIFPHRSAANQSSVESPTPLLPQTHPKRMATPQTDGHNSNGWPHHKRMATLQAVGHTRQLSGGSVTHGRLPS